MIKSGSTAWQIIKPGVDLGLIDSIIITYKTLPGYGSRVLLQKRYPDDTRVNGDELLLPLSQADTTLLREEGGDRVRLELQYNYSSGAVEKSEIQTVHIGDTLATAFVDGSNPDEAQIEGLPIEFATGDAIVIESKNKCVKDWNENDPESEKYIEGRTHYKKPTYPSDAPMIETLTAGATLLYDFTGLSATYINRLRYENATDPDGRYPFEWSWEAKLSTGWMAAESTSAGNGFAEKIDDANFRIMGNKTYDFYLYFISDPALLTPEYANRFPKKGVYVTVNDSGTANIRNFKAGFVVVAQLKRNYIPSTIARTADVVSLQQSTDDAGKALVIGEDGVVKPAEVETAQPDFSAGEGEPGHILNRTHYRATVPEYVCFEGQVNYNNPVTVSLEYEVSAGATVEQYLDGKHLCTLTARENYGNIIASDGRIQADFYNSDKTLKVSNYFNDGVVKIVVRNLEVLKPLDEEFIPSTIARKNYVDEAVANAGGNLIVTFTENDDGTLTPSHTSQEIYAACTGGKSVTAVWRETFYFSAMLIDENITVFSRTMVGDPIVEEVVIVIEGDTALIEEYNAPPMTPATADEDGASGLVPAPAAGQQDMVLHGDGTWRAVEGGGSGGDGDSGVLYVTLTPIPDTTFYTPSHTSAEIYAAHESGKYVYTRIEETVDGATTSVVLSLNICSDEMALFTAESALTADTTSILLLYDMAVYSYVSTEMKGATADQNGHQGAVPAPAKGQQDMVLHGDGTWRAVEGGETWELLADVTIEEAVNNFDYAFDSPQKKLKVIVDSVAADADTNYSGFTMWCKNEAGSTYYPNIMFYPVAIPRKTAKTSVYDISTYYIGDIPCIDVSTMIEEDKRYGDNASRRYFAAGLTEPYFGKMMVPEIVRFSQNTYGTFAAGTRYRIYGVKA